jgi:hypothetical protein
MPRKAKALVQVSARIDARVVREFNLKVARLGYTKRQSVEEAMRDWTERQEAERLGRRTFPIIHAEGRKKFDLTKQQIDEAMFG